MVGCGEAIGAVKVGRKQDGQDWVMGVYEIMCRFGQRRELERARR